MICPNSKLHLGYFPVFEKKSISLAGRAIASQTHLKAWLRGRPEQVHFGFCPKLSEELFLLHFLEFYFYLENKPLQRVVKKRRPQNSNQKLDRPTSNLIFFLRAGGRVIEFFSD